jgi:hypothetical protein
MRRSRRVVCTLALFGLAIGNGLGCSDSPSENARPTTGGATQAQAGAPDASGGVESSAGGNDFGGVAGSTAADGGRSGTGIVSGGVQASAGTSGSANSSQAGNAQAGVAQAGVSGMAPSNAGRAGASNAGAAGKGLGGNKNTAGSAGVAGSAGSCTSDMATNCVLNGTVLGPSPKDSDCDGIPDAIEVGPNGKEPRDTDGDGKPDYLSLDSDNDTIPDSVEVGPTCNLPRDTDGDGLPDYRDLDSDGNGTPDERESLADSDGDGTPDFADLDDDGDFLTDVMEIGGDPLNPLDTDHDGIKDWKDTDSDNDTILDRDERANDADKDGLPNYRDLDSDGDGILDAIEAGDAILTTPPVDTDADALPDFLDLDSDGDGLLDSVEDKNLDGVLDPGETSRVKADTDGDGVSDLIEVAAGTNPQDPADNPAAHGNFVFLVPYQLPPNPTTATLDFTSKISLADIFLLIDTTRSMDGEIDNLQKSLATVIIPQLAAEIDSIAIGVGSYRDFPTSSYGSAGDWPFKLEHRIMTVRTAAGIASLQVAVNGLSADTGGDYYEASWEALHQVAKGTGNATGGASVAAFNTASAYPATPPEGESIGTIPGVGFRSGALPVAVLFTDAPGHNSDSATVTANDYASPVVAAHSTQTIDEFKKMSARLVGVTSGLSDARADELEGITKTGALVPPAAWGTGAARPAGCAADQCCTGLSGTGEAAGTTGRCPLSFLMSDDGSGLGTAVVAAIKVLTSYGSIDVSAHPIDDPSDSIDAVAAFIDGIVANPSAGPPCDSGLTAIDTTGDGRLDTFVDVLPGKRVCFDVIPKTNQLVSPKDDPQMYKASIQILGENVTILDTRNVFFLVPPAPPQ